MFITWALVRVKYRSSPGTEELLTDGNPVNLSMETNNFVYQIKKGSSIRLRICNARGGFIENPLSGESITAQTYWGKARVTLYHNHKYQSKIVLPVVSRAQTVYEKVGKK